MLIYMSSDGKRGLLMDVGWWREGPPLFDLSKPFHHTSGGHSFFYSFACTQS